MTNHIFSSKHSPTPDSEIPLLQDRVSAGFASPGEYDSYESLDLNELIVKNRPATFFMRVEGDSMIEANIFSGDIVVIDRSVPPMHNKIVVAIVNNELLIKRLIKSDKVWTLCSENPSYAPVVITEGLDAAIWGVVTYIIHAAK